MAQSNSWKEFKLETPATYRIRIQGRLDKSWTDRLGGMAIKATFLGLPFLSKRW